MEVEEDDDDEEEEEEQEEYTMYEVRKRRWRNIKKTWRREEEICVFRRAK